MITFTGTHKEVYAGIVAITPYIFSGLSEGFSTQYIFQINSRQMISESEMAWIGSSGELLTFAGCLVDGYLMDTFGRKSLFYSMFAIHFVGWMIVAKTTYFFCGRILLSFAIGLGYGCTIYVAEILRPQYRGAFLSLTSSFSLLGNFLVNLIEFYVSPETTSLVMSISAVVIFINVFLIPESPYWYMLTKQKEKAIKSLRWLRGDDELAVESEINDIENSLDDTRGAASFANVIFNRKWWRIFLFFSLFVVLTELNGFEAIMTYLVQFFEKINRTELDSRIISTIFLGTASAGTIVTVFIVELFKRTSLVKYTNLGNAILLVIAATSETFFHSPGVSVVPLICFIMYSTTVSITDFTLPWTIISESLPTESRATIFSALCAEYCIISSIITGVFPFVLSSISISYIIWSFALFSLSNYVFVHCFLKDTRGITLPGNKNIL